jgi:hypothetical protein
MHGWIMNREAQGPRNVSREHEGGVCFEGGKEGLRFAAWQALRKGCNHSLTAVLRYEAGVGFGFGKSG